MVCVIEFTLVSNVTEIEGRIYTNKKRVLQHRTCRNKQTMTNIRESKWNWINMNMNTIKWNTNVTDIKNTEVSII